MLGKPVMFRREVSSAPGSSYNQKCWVRFRYKQLVMFRHELGLGVNLCLTALPMTSMVRDREKCTGHRLSSNEPSELWFDSISFSSS